MRLLIATLLVVATTGMANAYCVSVPDTQASGYVSNGLRKTVCLNDELSQTTAVKNWQVQVNTALGQLDRAMIDSKINDTSSLIPNPVTPAWP